MAEDEYPKNYFFKVTGERARELLFLYGHKGEFLVRPSESNPYDHTVSIHRGDRITNVKLQGRDGIHKLPNGDEFLHLDVLVKYLMETPDLLYERDGTSIEIKVPVTIPQSESVVKVGSDRFFHVGTSGMEAEELLQDETNGTFLVRESASIKGEFAMSVKTDEGVIHVRIYHDEARFRITPKDEFRSLPDLVENYMRVPMVQYSGLAIPLKQPLMSTRFTAATVDERIDTLLKIARKAHIRDGIAAEFDKLQHLKNPHVFLSCKEGRRLENVPKNRFRNVVPFDHTRIKLATDGSPEQSDYINANLIQVLHNSPCYTDFDGIDKQYISTQGCLQNTAADFWRMIWQLNCRVIAMTTKEMERGRMKCHKYWPEMEEPDENFGPDNEFRVRTIKKVDKGEYLIRVLQLRRTYGPPNHFQSELRELYHYQFLGWEDNGCPSRSLLQYLEEVNDCMDKKAPKDCGPLVVHCSAGIGRTGTFIVLDILLTKIKLMGPHTTIDIAKTIRMVREQRATMVQTEAQYRFLYHAISTFMQTFRTDLNLHLLRKGVPDRLLNGMDPRFNDEDE
ncbi:hypothetical protein M3Y95_00250500 [Aphelenchoides besseyi]|nr:hypothetical protein M3Y95_00250500 [Aphelenchoides besseyi]